MITPPFLRCESHPRRPLTAHLTDVASRLEMRTGQKGGPLWIAGLCHDLGKATSYFQDYLLKRQLGDARLKAHALFGAFWMSELLVGDGDSESMLSAALHLAFVRGHHGRLDNLRDALALDAAEEQRCQQRKAAADVAGIATWLGEQLEMQPVRTPLFSGKTLQLWRIRLNSTLTGKMESDLAMRRFQTALRDFGWLIAADRDSAAGEGSILSITDGPALVTDDLNRFRLVGDFGSGTAVQLAAARDEVYRAAVQGATLRPATGGHLWTLQVPTGSGKTLAALGWATERRRLRELAGLSGGAIFYALPFTSIIDQAGNVVRRIWPQADQSGALAIHHHLADYGTAEEEKYEGAQRREWAEAWRSDVVCTTFVQIVHALFHGTTADSRRFAALAQGSILILDEAQALPAELWPTLRIALQSLAVNFGLDVLLLTATNPALLQDEDAPADLSPKNATIDLATIFDRYDVSIEEGPPWSVSKLVEVAGSCLENSTDGIMHSGLLLLNTVNEALSVYAFAKEHTTFRGRPLLHLSTNLRPKDRAQILEELRSYEKAGEPCLLVATQVVEAGVDLSFDVVFRAEAPLDAIVQAAGRCNRHGIGPRGEVRVFRLGGASANRIYGDIKMGAARELLNELAVSFEGKMVPEPEFSAKVPEFFRRIAARMGAAQNKKRKVIEAVTAFEFAKLRGEGVPSVELQAKHIYLISEDGNKIPVFVETDQEDADVWTQLIEAYQDTDLRRRRARLREMRASVGARIVEVPQNLNPPPSTGLIVLGHVPLTETTKFYDTRTGWHRHLPN